MPAAAPAFVLTGTFSSLTATDTGYVTIELQAFRPFIPRVSGYVIEPTNISTAPPAASFSVTLYGNDVIVPGNTYYLITVFDANGRPVSSGKYILQGSGGDLSNLLPTGVIPAPSPIMATVPAGEFLAGPPSGAGAPPVYRAIQLSDLQVDVYSSAYQVVGSSATEAQTIQEALAGLPATGGVIDMRFANTPAALALGNFDPGLFAGPGGVTVLLGPYQYTATQITIRNGLHFIGMGASQTFLQATPSSTNLFVLGGTTPSLHVLIQGINISGGAASVDCFHIFAVIGGGLWYSEFDDLVVGAGGFFSGNPFHFDANAGGSGTSINQFLTFRDIEGYRAVGGAPCFLASGLNGQFVFVGECEFDCAAAASEADNGTNIYINDGTQTYRAPYNFNLQNVTCQKAWGTSGIGIHIAGVNDVSIIDGHFETCNGAIKIVSGTTYASLGTHIIGCSFDTLTGINGGSGYILYLDAVSNAFFASNTVASTPDTFFAGTPTLLTHFSTMNSLSGGLQPEPSQVPNEFLAKRFGEINGTLLTAGNFSFSTGWGTAPSVTFVRGTSAGFMIDVQAGTGSLSANPTVTLTFPDGPWTFPPVCVTSRTDASAPAGAYWAYNLPGSTTNAVFSFVGTPSSGTGYGLNAILFDKQN